MSIYTHARAQQMMLWFTSGSSFAEAPSPDWDNADDVYEALVGGIDQSSLMEDRLENESHVDHFNAYHDKIQALKSNSTMPFWIYAGPSGNTAGDGNAASKFYLSDTLEAAMGHQMTGTRHSVSGDSSTTSTIDCDAVTGLKAGMAVFPVDADTSKGQFAIIKSITTTTASIFPPLSFTPADSDVVNAGISVGENKTAQNDHTQADHKTLSAIVRGEDDQDVVELIGCKPTLASLDNIEAGTAPKFNFELMAADWNHDDNVSGSIAAMTGTLVSVTPRAVSRGDQTSVYFGDKDGTLSDVPFFSVEPGLNCTWQAIKGPNGKREGVHHYVANPSDILVNVTLAYSGGYWDEARDAANNKKSLLFQVGDVAGEAWGVFYPHLEYIAAPVRTEVNGRLACQLQFRARQWDGDVSAEDEESQEMLKSKAIIMFSA